MTLKGDGKAEAAYITGEYNVKILFQVRQLMTKLKGRLGYKIQQTIKINGKEIKNDGDPLPPTSMYV